MGFLACVPTARLQDEQSKNQEISRQLNECKSLLVHSDSLRQALDLCQNNLLKTEKTLTEFYIRYKTQENLSSENDSLQKSTNKKDVTGFTQFKILRDSIEQLKKAQWKLESQWKQCQTELSQKEQDFSLYKKSHETIDEKLKTQDKRISDFFSALYHQRTAYDSLQVEYYTLHKSKNTTSPAHRIDPDENIKLKKLLNKKDSSLFDLKVQNENKDYQIRQLKNQNDSLKTLTPKPVSMVADTRRTDDSVRILRNELEQTKISLQKQTIQFQNQASETEKQQIELKKLLSVQDSLNAENRKLKSSIEELKSENKNLITSKKEIANKTTGETKTELWKIKSDSLQNIIEQQQTSMMTLRVQIRDSASSRDRYWNSILQQKNDSIFMLRRDSKTISATQEVRAQNTSGGSPKNSLMVQKIFDHLQKISGADSRLLKDEDKITMEIPQTVLFTEDLFTLNQSGSEFIIKISQALSAYKLQSIQILGGYDKNKNERMELMFGRSKTIGKLMNIYGIKSDQIGFGIQPETPKELILIQIKPLE